MTTLITALALILAIYVALCVVTKKARFEAARLTSTALLSDLDLFMGLNGFQRRVKDAPVWGRPLGRDALAYRVEANASTGVVTLTVVKLDSQGKPGAHPVSVRLTGSCVKAADVLDMKAQARAFLADCTEVMLPPVVDVAGARDKFLSLLDRITFAPRLPRNPFAK